MLANDPTNLPPLVTAIASTITGIGIGVAGLKAYLKERREPSGGKDVILASATFADRKTVERLVEALERNGDAFNRNADSNHLVVDEVRALRRAIVTNTEEVRSSTDMIINLAAWLKARQTGG